MSYHYDNYDQSWNSNGYNEKHCSHIQHADGNQSVWKSHEYCPRHKTGLGSLQPTEWESVKSGRNSLQPTSDNWAAAESGLGSLQPQSNDWITNSQPAIDTDTKTSTKNNDLLEQVENTLKNKGSITVDFDKCNFDDSKYTGDYNTDPMGTLKAGQKYTVSYDSQKGFTTTGFNQDTNSNISRTYNNGNLNENQISLWGRVYSLKQGENGDVTVIDPTYGEVGIIELTK